MAHLNRISICVAAAALYGQQPEDGFRLTVRNAVEALQTGETPARHWVLDALPAEGDILVTNTKLKARIAELLTAMRADTACLKWAVELGPDCSFSGRLVRDLTAFNLRAVNMILPPADGQMPAPVLRVRYAPPVDRPMGKLRVEISAPGSESAPGVFVNVPAAVARIGRSPFAGGFDAVEIAVRPSAVGEEEALLRAALDGLAMMEAAGFEPGKPAPTDQQMLQVSTAVEERYRIPRTSWPAPKVNFQLEAPGSPDFVFSMQRLQVARKARARVVRGQIQGVEGMVDFAGATAAGEETIKRRLAAATTELEGRFRSDFDKLAMSVPIGAEVDALRERVGKDRAVSGVVAVRVEGADLVFEGERRWVIGALNGRAALAGSLNPQDFITGEAVVDGANLLRNILPFSIGETYLMSFRGGPEVQKADFTFAIPRTRGGINYGFDINAFYHRDRNQRLGNLVRDYRLLNREQGLLPRLYGEVQGGKRGWDLRSRVEVSQDWREVLIEPRNAALPPVISGQLAAWNFSGKQTVGFPGAKSGIGPSRLNFEASKRMGRRSLRGDFAFDQFVVAARGQVFFGPWTREDFLIRYKRGVGQSSAATPIFLLHRLGGPDNVRGLENGEFVGRQLGFEQSEFGVKLAALPRIFGRKPGPAPADGAPVPQFDLSKFLLVGFHDRGLVVDQGSVGDLLGLRGARHGYGVAVELRDLPVGTTAAHLQLGWARSPNSVLHKKGLMSVRIVFDF